MIKMDIVQNISERAEIPRGVALKAVDIILDEIKSSLVHGDRIEIRGFGVFQKKLRKQSVGRDMQKAETIKIPETFTVKFKPGTDMRVLD